MADAKSSWSFVGITSEAREAAEEAAEAAGMELDAWLAQLIKYTSAMELSGRGVSLDDVIRQSRRTSETTDDEDEDPGAEQTFPGIDRMSAPPGAESRFTLGDMGAPDQIPVAPGEGAVEETEEEESPLEDIAIPTDPTRPVEIALDKVHPSALSALNAAREADVEAALDQWRRTSRMEPLIVRRRPNVPNEFEVIVGIERLHAARRAQLRDIPVLVRDLDDSEALKAGLAARLKGRHISALKEATIYLQLMTEASQSTEQVAALVGKPAGHVASMVRILNLPQSVRGMLERGEITVLHARALLNAHNPEAIARQVVAQRLDIYQTEQLVRSSRQGADTIRSQDVLDEADIDADEAFAAEDQSDLGEGTAERQPSHEEVTERKQQPSVPPAAMAEPDRERRQGRTAGSSATTIPFPEGGRAREAGRESAEEDNASTELLERHLSQLLGLKVSISERDNMGIMAFHYTDRDQLSRLIARLNRSVDQ